MSRMHVGETFRDTILDIYNATFERCVFIRCKFYYGGDRGIQFKDCSFEQTEWIFYGPADNTLVFLSSLYHGFGQQGQELVEAIFDNVRSGRVSSDVEVTQAATGIAS